MPARRHTETTRVVAFSGLRHSLCAVSGKRAPFAFDRRSELSGTRLGAVMNRRFSAVVVASGMASIAALTIAGWPLQERSSGLHTDPLRERRPARRLVSSSPTSVTIVASHAPRPGAASPAPPDRTTVAARPPTSAGVAPANLPSVTTSPPAPDTVVVETPTTAPQEYVLDIESIDLHEPVVAGGQDEIDQGFVTAVDWSFRGYPASCLPGAGCTVWLAGHRSTHQAVFARLPEIAAGALIEIHFHGQALRLHSHRRGHRARNITAVGDPW